MVCTLWYFHILVNHILISLTSPPLSVLFLLLTNLLHAYCFILWPIEFNQEHLCNHGHRTIWALWDHHWVYSGAEFPVSLNFSVAQQGGAWLKSQFMIQGYQQRQSWAGPVQSWCELKITVDMSCPEDGNLQPCLQPLYFIYVCLYGTIWYLALVCLVKALFLLLEKWREKGKVAFSCVLAMGRG